MSVYNTISFEIDKLYDLKCSEFFRVAENKKYSFNNHLDCRKKWNSNDGDERLAL